jgi:hypothetical protein
MKVKSQSQEPDLYEHAVSNSIDRRRAAEFQAGHNPMQQTAFEKSLCHGESEERWRAKENYVAGIQGTDGGCCEKREKHSLS